jgi:hypothetical protein
MKQTEEQSWPFSMVFGYAVLLVILDEIVSRKSVNRPAVKSKEISSRSEV